MEVDLSRPPARLPSRIPVWVGLAILYGVSFAVYIVTLGLLHEPSSRVVDEVLLVVLVAATALFLYAQWHLFPAADGQSAARAVYGPTDDSHLIEGRIADHEERKARKDLRRGRITRREYERIIATRRFAHGEITRLELHDVLRQLGYDHAAEGAVGSTAEGLP